MVLEGWVGFIREDDDTGLTRSVLMTYCANNTACPRRRPHCNVGLPDITSSFVRQAEKGSEVCWVVLENIIADTGTKTDRNTHDIRQPDTKLARQERTSPRISR